MTPRRLLAAVGALALSACASTAVLAPLTTEPGWSPALASIRQVGLGLPGGARLAEGVRFAGGIEIVADPVSPLHSLSDLKLLGDGFVAVSDAGDLIRGRIVLDDAGRLIGIEGLTTRRLTLADGSPIAEKADGDAEGLAVTRQGDLLISFERDHRIWDYGRPEAPSARPVAVRRPDFAFAPNGGIEGLAASPAGWIVAGEDGGVWDCHDAGCRLIDPPPPTPLPDRDYRITGLDEDPARPGWYAVQRLFAPPVDARAQVRRLQVNGELGPVLVELKLPGLTDNFEGIAAVRRGDATRLYILSDDNGSRLQRTLLLAFDVSATPAR